MCADVTPPSLDAGPSPDAAWPLPPILARHIGQAPQLASADGLPALVDVAVEARGRATPTAIVAAEVTSVAPTAIPVLAHAGPSAARHLRERPVGASEIAVVGGRRPQALDDGGWRALQAAIGAAARHLERAGARALALSVDGDGLLACALSPRTTPALDEALRVRCVVDVLAAARGAVAIPVGVVLTVEERVPHGIDATLGRAAARALVDAGAAFVIATIGTAGLDALLAPPTSSIDTGDPFLAAGAWLEGTVAVPVLAQGPTGDAARSLRRARAHGLHGVVVDARPRAVVDEVGT